MRAVFVTFFLLLVCAGCASPAPEQVAQVLPTVTAQPSETPTEMASPTATIDFALTAAAWLTETQNAVHLTQTARVPTSTHTVTPTETPNAILTEFARLAATNVAAQQTIIALQSAQNGAQTTRTSNMEAAPTTTPTPTPEPTMTPTPTPDGVMPIQATILYARLPADLYTCPSRGCELRARLDIGVPMVADGTTNGEAINGNSPLWYRLNFNGEWVFIYGEMTTANPPTQIPLNITSSESTVEPLAICPRNCTEAVAWGVSAQHAAACGLDRDGDGMACYGD